MPTKPLPDRLWTPTEVGIMNTSTRSAEATSVLRRVDLEVRKYGGSSLATPGRVANVADAIATSHRDNGPLVIVVSAQGDATDHLLSVAQQAGGGPTERETDQLLATGECASAALLAMALQARGTAAVSLAGWQAGIQVIGPPGKAVIASIDTSRITSLLAAGVSVVIAGFQGVDQHGDLLTLGRGGSDTTAVALTIALSAQRCEIYTDVDGVFSADPRLVSDARLLPTVEVSVMAEMAFAGARVMHSRAVELAAMNSIDFYVRNSFQPHPGTLVTAGNDPHALETRGVVIGVTQDADVARVLVQAVAAGSDLAAEVLAILADHSVPVDLVARSGPYETEFRMGFTIRCGDLSETRHLLEEHVRARGGTLQVDTEVAKVSLVGMGLLNRPQYTARVLTVLSAAGISSSWISTSQLRTSVVVPRARVGEAVHLLHREFDLDRPAATSAVPSPSHRRSAPAVS